MVATTMPPALSTPSQAGEQHRIVGPAQKTRLPGTRPFLFDQQAGDPVGEVAHLAIGPAAGIVDHGERVGILPVDQLDGGVEPLRILELGQVEEEFGLLARAAAAGRG